MKERRTDGSEVVPLPTRCPRCGEPTNTAGQCPNCDWYFSPEWQEGERRADEEIAYGRLRRFGNVEGLIADLHAD